MQQNNGNQLSIYDYALPRKVINKPIRLIELFGGIGAQAKALTALGANYENYIYVDYDKFAVKSYNAIHDTEFSPQDIRAVKGRDLGINANDGYEYVLTYSFPCTSLSMVGNRAGMARGSEAASALLWEVDRLLRECNIMPGVLLMENVPQVNDQANRAEFAAWRRILDSLGYISYYAVLDAQNYGIPQQRKRMYMVSLRGASYAFPRPTPLSICAGAFFESNLDNDCYLTHKALCGLRRRAKRANKELAIVSPQGISKTILAHGESSIFSNYIYANGKYRYYTPLETWRFMGFTDNDFNNAVRAGVSNYQLYKQAGNSIVVTVLMAIFGELLQCDYITAINDYIATMTNKAAETA